MTHKLNAEDGSQAMKTGYTRLAIAMCGCVGEKLEEEEEGVEEE